MSVMQNELCTVLDRMGISYETDVSPLLETDWNHEEEEEFATAGEQETTEDSRVVRSRCWPVASPRSDEGFKSG
jgi:hypothetical protein